MVKSDHHLGPREVLAVTLLFVILTLILTYPLSVHPGSQALPGGADTDLTLWIFGWDVHALTHHPLRIFDGNIYYPYEHTLAYSENMIGSALLSAPIIWLTGNLVLAMNVAALLSCVLCGVGTYVLARRLGLGPTGAVIAAIVFAFAPPRFFRLGQLHLTTIQWMPFCLASLHRYLDEGNRRSLRWACAFFILQVYTSGHAAVLTGVSVLILIVWRVSLGEPIQLSKRVRDLGISGLLLLALAIPVLLPYRAVQQEMGLRRSLRESFLFAPNAASFIASPTYVDRFLLSLMTDAPLLETAKALLFPGYLAYLLAAAGVLAIKWPFSRGPSGRTTMWTRLGWLLEMALVVGLVIAIYVTFNRPLRLRFGSVLLLSARQPWRIWAECVVIAGLRFALLHRAPLDVMGRLRRLNQRLRRWSTALRGDQRIYYVVLALVSFWLALGPGYGLYTLVYDWPGFSFIRVPSRFTLITLLALAILAGSGFERWTQRLSSVRQRVLTTVTVLLLVGEFAVFPLVTSPYVVNIPAIDRWLNTQPKPFVLAEVPVHERLQGAYMIHSTAHWQKTVHGYSGMRPALHSALYDEMATFPDERSLTNLSNLGVTHIVVHTELYGPGEWPTIETRLRAFSDWLQLAHIEGEGRVYTLRSPAAVK